MKSPRSLVVLIALGLSLLSIFVLQSRQYNSIAKMDIVEVDVQEKPAQMPQETPQTTTQEQPQQTLNATIQEVYYNGKDSLGRNMTIANNSTQLCIVARTYEKQFPYLLPFLLSLYNPKSRPYVFITITDKSDLRKALKISQFVNEFVSEEYTFLIPPIIKKSTDYGYKMTDYAIDLLLDPKYNCEYFMFTNGDNVYGKHVIDQFILPLMQEGFDIFGFDFVSYYKWHDTQEEIREDGTVIRDFGSHVHRGSEFRLSMIDLGAFGIRKTMLGRRNDTIECNDALKVELINSNSTVEVDTNRCKDMRFMELGGHDLFRADGYFIIEASKRAKKKVWSKAKVAMPVHAQWEQQLVSNATLKSAFAIIVAE